MRTTLTLDPAVFELIKREERRRGVSFKQVVNEAIQRGLTAPAATAGEAFRVTPHHARLRPGFDRRAFNQLADQLEDDGVIAKTAGGGSRRSKPGRRA